MAGHSRHLDWGCQSLDPGLDFASSRYAALSRGSKAGLGLWNSVAGTMVVEFTMFAGGVGLYLLATRPRDRVGRYAFASYVAFLLALYIGDRFDTALPTVGELAWTGIVAMIVFIPWAWWCDHHREARSTGE